MESDQRILASRRAILLRRGIPAQFVDDIATRDHPRAFFSAVFIVVWFAAAVAVEVAFPNYVFMPIAYIYPARVLDMSGLFIPGRSQIVVGVIYMLAFPLLPVLLSIAWSVRPGRDRSKEGGVLNNLAFALRERGLKEDFAKIQPDPAFFKLADLPNSEAFLSAVVKVRAAKSKDMLTTGRLFLAGIVAVFAAACWISSQTYDAVDNDILDHISLTSHTSVPLSQAIGAQASCIFHSSNRGSDYYRPAYVVSFNATSVDLFNAQNLLDVKRVGNTLAKVADIDSYLRNHNVPVGKLASNDAANCVEGWSRGNRAQLNRVLTGQPAN